jgi:hypothetical protein
MSGYSAAARTRYAFSMIVGEELEQLRLLLWSRNDFEISEEEALALYESNRQWVEPEEMSETERRFFDDLVARLGRGVFHG